jgi:hypothetical protein
MAVATTHAWMYGASSALRAAQRRNEKLPDVPGVRT